MKTPRLHPAVYEQVKAAVDIVDVVNEHVPLKRQGKNLLGYCPFHDDKKRPSFTVEPAKNFYYCFSCQSGGNGIKFLMELKKTSFEEVVISLAERYNIPLQTLEPEQEGEFRQYLTERSQLYEVMAIAARFYQHYLNQAIGAAAKNYLLETRQLDESIIQSFQFGYAPQAWDEIYKYLCQKKGFAPSLIETAGLIVPRENGNGYYDRFRHRLIIPICDSQGRVIGFGGRSLDDTLPKYLNSPDTPLFEKGKTLFAIDKARDAILRQDEAIVVEGYFDVISLHAANITNVVGSQGTALSREQIHSLLRFTQSKRLIFNFDADSAGSKAADRAIGEVADLARDGAVNLRIVSLPQGKDPDEFLRQHSADAYRELLEGAPQWVEWQLEQIMAQGMDTAEGYQSGMEAICKALGQLESAIMRTHYIRWVAEKLAKGETRKVIQLEDALLDRVRGHRWIGKAQKWETPEDRSLREVAEGQILMLYIHCPDLQQRLLSEWKDRDLEFELEPYRHLWKLIQTLQQESDDSEAVKLFDRLQDWATESTEATAVNHLLYLAELEECDLVAPLSVALGALACLEKINCEKRCRHLLDLWQDLDPVEDRAKFAEIQTSFYTEKRRIQELNSQRGAFPPSL